MIPLINSISDEKRRKFNEKEWRVDGLPQIILPIRIIDATGLGLGPFLLAYVCLFLIEKLIVKPNLERSLRQMQIAEESGKVPLILCDENARREMKERITTLRIDIQNSQSLTCFGKFFFYLSVLKCLRGHQGLLALGQEAHEERVITPVFIASLPRTGSTILHRLMSLDRKRWRTFDFCDQLLPLQPSPIPRNDEGGRKKLGKLASKILNVMELLFPGWNSCIASVHSVTADEANEDHVWYNSALGYSFVGANMFLYQEERANSNKDDNIIPLYSKESAKYRYAWLHMILRIYQNIDKLNDKCNGKSNEYVPWLLKDPRHGYCLSEILREFPDAKFIFTHRPPRDVFPSATKLLICNTCIFNVPGAKGTSSKEWGTEMLARTKSLCTAIVDFTKKHEGTKLGIDMVESGCIRKSDRRIDLRFEDFVKDIQGAIIQIYQQFFPDQFGPTKDVLEKFNVYMSKRKSKSSQRCKLEDFHITESELNFPEYTSMFC